MQASDQAALLEAIIKIARDAGDLILEVYKSDFEVRGKDDASPVTAADEQAEALILKGLRSLSLQFPIIAEEAHAAGDIPQVDDCFWLVDPLDGTREFVNRNGEFTVNIALIENGKPLLGVVLAPVLNQLYAGSRDNGAFMEGDDAVRRDIHVRKPSATGLDVLASRSHGDAAALTQLLEGRKILPQGMLCCEQRVDWCKCLMARLWGMANPGLRTRILLLAGQRRFSDCQWVVSVT